ncbi:RNA polymerase sigma factor SigJ [Actinomadura meridiana]|uniref:RNA polymerase sigma factor SigJ n=1 Tax=Actinomadura meridiana TaxID=559626 RepID=A0ABP8BSL7_9ACTN
MDQSERLAHRFETHRPHLRTVAYGILGSVSEAEDAVQEAWFRLSRTDTEAVDNLGGWLTTVVARVCLDMLRRRRTRGEEPIGLAVPEPIVTGVDGGTPEEEALMADSVGLALMVVLHALTPAERLAYVLHDMFGVPYDEISTIIGRTPGAARQLASRARRRIQESRLSPGEWGPVPRQGRGQVASGEAVAPPGGARPDPELSRRREVVDAFFAAARDGDFDALLGVLDPDVVLYADHDPNAVSRGGPMKLCGAEDVARRALGFASFAQFAHPVLVNGDVGVVVAPHGIPFSVLGFTVRERRIARIHVFAEPARLRRLGVVTSIPR